MSVYGSCLYVCSPNHNVSKGNVVIIETSMLFGSRNEGRKKWMLNLLPAALDQHIFNGTTCSTVALFLILRQIRNKKEYELNKLRKNWKGNVKECQWKGFTAKVSKKAKPENVWIRLYICLHYNIIKSYWAHRIKLRKHFFM